MNRTVVGLSRASTSELSIRVKDVDGRDKPGHDELGTERFASARLRQQRQLPRLRLVLGVICQVRGIGPGEAMVGEFRIEGIAAGFAHGPIHAVDRQVGGIGIRRCGGRAGESAILMNSNGFIRTPSALTRRACSSDFAR